MDDIHRSNMLSVPLLALVSRLASPSMRRLFLGLAAILSITALFAQTPFVPNDPYFNPASDTPATDQPSAGYYGQWYLINQMPVSATNAGLDVNIAGAWARGLTGAGVIIAIADSNGVEITHPDLAAHFANTYSYSLSLSAEQNGAPGFLRGAATRDGLYGDGDNHGTAVAGVAVAIGGNGIGLTGAAPGAQFASINIRASSLPEGVTYRQAQAAAILFQGQTDIDGNPNPYVAYVPTPGTPPPVRIMNHSYGNATGYVSEGAEIPALRASAELGVIHVYAAGNQRYTGPNPRPTADSNKSESQASPDVITVAGLASDGVYSMRSSFGANIFVTAPSDSIAGSGRYGIPTTDRVTTANGYNFDPTRPDPYFNFSNPGSNDGSSYFSAFGGTSASAPLVAGIIALGVEANSNMNLRMAQHLLAQTSRVIDPTDTQSPTNTGGWITNAAGYHFNNNYGFGLIDADAFTLAATQYSGVTDEARHTTGDVGVGLSFAEGLKTITRTTNVAFANALPLEFVQVHFLITGLEWDWDYYVGTEEQPAIGAIAGDFEAWLTSPDGTRNRLFLDDTGIPAEMAADRRNYASDTLDWSFTSYAYWGEDLNGDWTIELINHSNNTTDLGTWENYSMNFGTGTLVVPEPGSILLVAVGLGLVFLYRRKRHLPS